MAPQLKPREDPAFAAMTLDLLSTMLGRVGDPGQFGDSLAEGVRELTGARLVLLVQFAGADAVPSDEVVGANPRARRTALDSPALALVSSFLTGAKGPVVWRPGEGPAAGELMERLGAGLSLVVPLRLGASLVGALLALGLPEEERLDAVAEALETLSTVAALALRNASLYRRQEEVIAERTRNLETANAQLRRTQFAMDSAQDAVFWVNPEGAFTYVNDAACRLTGCSREELLTTVVGDLIPELADDAWRTHWDAVKEKRTVTFEALLGTRDGRRVWVEVRVMHLRYREEESHCAFVRDISERKRAEAEKFELERQLRHAQKMEAIGTFSGGIAHDFNNILTPIMAHAELALLSVPENHPVREELRGLLQAAERAAGLVQQILTISRKDEQEVGPLALGPLVKEVLKLLRASLPTTIEIREQIDSECGSVLAGPTRMHQVLLNLCANARDAMGPNGGILTVRVQRVDVGDEAREVPAGSYVCLTVSDTGSGIAPDSVDRIFEPYFTTKGLGEGTGLGLAVVHSIVRSFGGLVRVRSERGRGSSFDVLLPERAPSSAAESDDRAMPAPSGQRQRILFVDDEPAIVQVGRRIVAALGYEVTAVGSSGHALDLLRADPERYDALVTDQTMPGLTGADLTRAALALRPGLPVILCTGFSETLDAASARELGAVAFVMKPFTLATLGRVLAEALKPGVKPERRSAAPAAAGNAAP